MPAPTYYCRISRLRWLRDGTFTAEPCEWLEQRLEVVFQLLQLSSRGHRYREQMALKRFSRVERFERK